MEWEKEGNVMKDKDGNNRSEPPTEPVKVDCFWSKELVTIQAARDFIFTPTNSECRRCRKCEP